MVLTGEQRKEYDVKRYLKNKDKLHDAYIKKKGTAEGYMPAEPKRTNKINRPETYKKAENTIKIVNDVEINNFVQSELESKSRRKLNSIYGKECVSALMVAFNKLNEKK